MNYESNIKFFNLKSHFYFLYYINKALSIVIYNLN